MNPLLAAAVVVALLALATIVGVVARRRSARRRVRRTGAFTAQDLGLPAFGESATVVQFSTELCARCPGVHRTLAPLANQYEGVAFTDVDLTHRHDLAARFHVMQTPAVFVLDGVGNIAARFAGTVTRAHIVPELEALRRDPDVAPVH